jgi:hypothetical protein
MRYRSILDLVAEGFVGGGAAVWLGFATWVRFAGAAIGYGTPYMVHYD